MSVSAHPEKLRLHMFVVESLSSIAQSLLLRILGQLGITLAVDCQHGVKSPELDF